MGLSERDVEHVLESLRKGVVPERGLEAYAVGTDVARGEIQRQLGLVAQGEGSFKFLRGGYGCGKTFMSRLAVLDAQAQGFATSFVVVSDNDLHFYKFDDVYRKVVQELGTISCPRGALNDIIDRWIARVEDKLISAGADEDAPDFDDKVQDRIDEELASLTGGKAPEDMARVLRAVFRLKQAGKVVEAGALLSWLSGSQNVAASVKKEAEVKGDIGSKEALDYLHGILEIVKAAGYKGMVIVIDEAETILRMRRDVRGKSLNGIRQICDASGQYKGLLWLFTGTPEFFDTRRGVAGLEPLHDRIEFKAVGGMSNPKAPQLELKPFDAERLTQVAQKLIEVYPSQDAETLKQKVPPQFIKALVAQATEGFKGDVGVVPRQFLRNFVDVLDVAANNPDFDPGKALGLKIEPVNEAERRLQEGEPPFKPESEDDQGYQPVEF